MNRYVALTGGIGCGKSVVSKIFSCMDIPVYDSDSRAKNLMNTDSEIVSSMVKLLGEQIYKDSVLQKNIVAQMIFTNRDLCRKVNEIVHPRVWNDYKIWSDKQKAPFTVMETALLYETDLYKNFDKSIFVNASDEIRIQRVMRRDNCDRNAVLNRIKNQSSIENALQKADFIIENSDTFVVNQVVDIYNKLMQE